MVAAPHAQRGVEEDADDVDAHGPAGAPGRREVGGGQLAQLALLARVDRLDGEAEPGAAARLDLDDDDCVAVEGDDVDLADPAAPVAVDDRQPGGAQVLDRGRLPGGRDASVP